MGFRLLLTCHERRVSISQSEFTQPAPTEAPCVPNVCTFNTRDFSLSRIWRVSLKNFSALMMRVRDSEVSSLAERKPCSRRCESAVAFEIHDVRRFTTAATEIKPWRILLRGGVGVRELSITRVMEIGPALSRARILRSSGFLADLFNSGMAVSISSNHPLGLSGLFEAPTGFLLRLLSHAEQSVHPRAPRRMGGVGSPK
jgi:hypothetical protein